MSEKMSRAERLKARQENSGKRGGGFQRVLNLPENVEKFKRAIEEQQTIAIVPFIVTSDIHPEYKAIMKDVEEFGDPATAFKLDYYVHNVPGMGKEVICRNMTYGEHGCPACAERARLLEEGNEWDSKEVKPYNAKHRTAHVVCLIDEDDAPLMVMDEAYGWWGKVLEEKASVQNVLLLDETEHGKNIQVFSMEHSWKTDKGEDLKMAGKASIKFVNREWGFSEEDMSEIDLCSFFTIESADEIYNAFHAIDGGGPSSGSDEDEEIIDTKPATSRRASTQDVETTSTSEVREPNQNSRRGRRGGSGTTEASTETASTPRGRARGGRGSAVAEDDITF